jgi:hypothetical protein
VALVRQVPLQLDRQRILDAQKARAEELFR